MLQEAYTTKELCTLLSLTKRSVLVRAKRENWCSRKRAGRGGGHEWLIASMPEETRAVITARLAASIVKEPPKSLDVEAVIPDWAFDAAKARFRLVSEWRAFVAQSRGNKTESTEQFLAAVRAGLILPADVLEAAGGYSAATLYRWWKQLSESGDDFTVLADRRGKWTQGGAKGLGQIGFEAEALLLNSWLTPNRPSMRLAYEGTATILRQRGEHVPSYATARRFLTRFAENRSDYARLKREGEKALRDKEGPYIARNDKILAVGDVLFSDGHVLNFDSLSPITGKPCRLTLIVFFDWRSRMPVGWEIMPEETTLAISSALHMGIRNLGKYPRVVYIDNGKAFRAKYFNSVSDFSELDGLYVRLGIDVQYSKPYAAQTKIVERFWGTFNEQCARLLPSYRGNSVDDKPAYLMRAENYHKKRHNDFIPTVQETAHIFAAFVQWYARNGHRGLDGATPWAVFEPGRGPGVDTAELDRHFLLRKLVTPKRTGFVIAGIRFESDALYGLNKPVLATYSWADMSEVSLFDAETGARLGAARSVEALNPLARVFGDKLDMQMVAAANKRQQQLRRSTLALAKEMDGKTEALDALPWMRPASERRAPLRIVSNQAAPKEIPAPALSQKEEAELTALASTLQAKETPEYQCPEFFGSESERYEYLFDISVAQGIPLTQKDAAWISPRGPSRQIRKSSAHTGRQAGPCPAMRRSPRAYANSRIPPGISIFSPETRKKPWRNWTARMLRSRMTATRWLTVMP